MWHGSRAGGLRADRRRRVPGGGDAGPAGRHRAGARADQPLRRADGADAAGRGRGDGAVAQARGLLDLLREAGPGDVLQTSARPPTRPRSRRSYALDEALPADFTQRPAERSRSGTFAARSRSSSSPGATSWPASQRSTAWTGLPQPAVRQLDPRPVREQPAVAPAHHRDQHGQQVAALLGQPVAVAGALARLLVGELLEQPLGGQLAQPRRDDRLAECRCARRTPRSGSRRRRPRAGSRRPTWCRRSRSVRAIGQFSGARPRPHAGRGSPVIWISAVATHAGRL